MTPLLLLVFDVAPLAAGGTNVWLAAITKPFATLEHHGHSLIDWPVVRHLWLGSLTASALTRIWMKLHPVEETAVTLLKTAIAVAGMLTATGMLLQKSLHALGRKLRTSESDHFKTLQLALTMLSGTMLGGLVTLTSVGVDGLLGVFLTPVSAASNATALDCHQYRACHPVGHFCRYGPSIDQQCGFRLAR